MDRVQIKNSEATLFVDTRFYEYDAIMAAADAFTSGCWVYVDGDAREKLMVCLKPRQKDVMLAEVGYEFYNHVLGLMKNAGR